jgi:hypothetical protein
MCALRPNLRALAVQPIPWAVLRVGVSAHAALSPHRVTGRAYWHGATLVSLPRPDHRRDRALRARGAGENVSPEQKWRVPWKIDASWQFGQAACGGPLLT